MWIHVPSVLVPTGARRGNRSLGVGVTGSFEPNNMSAGIGHEAFRRLIMFLTAKPFLLKLVTSTIMDALYLPSCLHL